MKNPLITIFGLALCFGFGVLALCQDKMFAVVFAIACCCFGALVELSNRK